MFIINIYFGLQKNYEAELKFKFDRSNVKHVTGSIF